MIQFLSLRVLFIFLMYKISPPLASACATNLLLISSGFALLKIYRKNRNRNTNPDDGRDRHPVNQFRRGDVPDRVHFFRVDVFCFFLKRARNNNNKRRERERVSQEREIANAYIPGSPGLPLAGADVRNPLVVVDAAVVVVRAAKRRKATIADIL
jgi:hypothetical protein